MRSVIDGAPTPSLRDRRGNAGATSSAPFAPTSIANLSAWYRADLLVSLNGSNVSAWGDSSGNGDSNRNATQGTAANQPAYTASNATYNNQATITFTSSQYLVTGVWSAAIAQPATVFVVGNSGGGADAYFFDSLSGAQMANYETGGAGGATCYATGGFSSGVRANAKAAIYTLFNGASSKIGVNAKTASATGTCGANGATGLTFGAYNGDTHQLGGPLAELAVYSRALAQSEIDQIMAYFGTRYSISIGA